MARYIARREINALPSPHISLYTRAQPQSEVLLRTRVMCIRMHARVIFRMRPTTRGRARSGHRETLPVHGLLQVIGPVKRLLKFPSADVRCALHSLFEDAPKTACEPIVPYSLLGTRHAGRRSRIYGAALFSAVVYRHRDSIVLLYIPRVVQVLSSIFIHFHTTRNYENSYKCSWSLGGI